MSPQQVFSIAGSLALVSWIMLAILPRRPWGTKVVTTKLVPGLFAMLYRAIAGSLFWRSHCQAVWRAPGPSIAGW